LWGFQPERKTSCRPAPVRLYVESCQAFETKTIRPGCNDLAPGFSFWVLGRVSRCETPERVGVDPHDPLNRGFLLIDISECENRRHSELRPIN